MLSTPPVISADNRKPTFASAWRNFWYLWRSPETFVFHSALDVIFGFFVLLAIPAISLWYVADGGGVLWSNYGFPFISITIAALYDTYGRYVSVESSDIPTRKVAYAKLILRAICSVVSLVISCLICGVSALAPIWWVPCIPLILASILLGSEGVQRLRTGFLLLFGGA